MKISTVVIIRNVYGLSVNHDNKNNCEFVSYGTAVLVNKEINKFKFLIRQFFSFEIKIKSLKILDMWNMKYYTAQDHGKRNTIVCFALPHKDAPVLNYDLIYYYII